MLAILKDAKFSSPPFSTLRSSSESCPSLKAVRTSVGGGGRLSGASSNSNTQCMRRALAYQALVFADTLPFVLQASDQSILITCLLQGRWAQQQRLATRHSPRES